jgi:hypothetical protein
MSRDDLANRLFGLSVGGLEAVSLQTLQGIFGANAIEGARALAADYGLELQVDDDGKGVTFTRPIEPAERQWLEEHKADVETDPAVPPLNAITAEDEHFHRRPKTTDDAKRPLELGGQGENSSRREGSQTDPDAD